MIVLDACVLIALTAPENRFNAAAYRILDTTETMLITALTGAELMVYNSPPQWGQWHKILTRLSIEVVDITANDMEAIAATRRETGLRMPDALVLWLAQSKNAAVASFDKQLLRKAAELGLRIITGS